VSVRRSTNAIHVAFLLVLDWLWHLWSLSAGGGVIGVRSVCDVRDVRERVFSSCGKGDLRCPYDLHHQMLEGDGSGDCQALRLPAWFSGDISAVHARMKVAFLLLAGE
jgi:hypothetical protein